MLCKNTYFNDPESSFDGICYQESSFGPYLCRNESHDFNLCIKQWNYLLYLLVLFYNKSCNFFQTLFIVRLGTEEYNVGSLWKIVHFRNLFVCRNILNDYLREWKQFLPYKPYSLHRKLSSWPFLLLDTCCSSSLLCIQIVLAQSCPENWNRLGPYVQKVSGFYESVQLTIQLNNLQEKIGTFWIEKIQC